MVTSHDERVSKSFQDGGHLITALVIILGISILGIAAGPAEQIDKMIAIGFASLLLVVLLFVTIEMRADRAAFSAGYPDSTKIRD